MKTLFAKLIKTFRRAGRPDASGSAQNRAGRTRGGASIRVAATLGVASTAMAVAAGSASAQEVYGPQPAALYVSGTFPPGLPTCGPTPAAPFPINGVDS